MKYVSVSDLFMIVRLLYHKQNELQVRNYKKALLTNFEKDIKINTN